jgi:hypothetical protein
VEATLLAEAGPGRGQDLLKMPAGFSDGSCRVQMVGMGTTFGDDSGLGEDQTQCISCKQHDIFMLAQELSGSDVKSNS